MLAATHQNTTMSGETRLAVRSVKPTMAIATLVGPRTERVKTGVV